MRLITKDKNKAFTGDDTTLFPIKNDVILIEDRGFNLWFQADESGKSTTLEKVDERMRRTKNVKNLRTQIWLGTRYRQKCKSSSKRVGVRCKLSQRKKQLKD